jgi:hypothetical protein
MFILMDERFVKRIITNNNAESFLPQNLSLNLLDFMVNDYDNSDSVLFIIHAVTILYKTRFNIPLDSPNSEIHNTFLFKSSLRKYLLILTNELDIRANNLKRSEEFTVDNVLF